MALEMFIILIMGAYLMVEVEHDGFWADSGAEREKSGVIALRRLKLGASPDCHRITSLQPNIFHDLTYLSSRAPATW